MLEAPLEFGLISQALLCPAFMHALQRHRVVAVLPESRHVLLDFWKNASMKALKQAPQPQSGCEVCACVLPPCSMLREAKRVASLDRVVMLVL